MRRRKAKKKPFAILFLLIIVGIAGYFLYNKMQGKNKTEKRFLANDVPEIVLKDAENKDAKTVYNVLEKLFIC